MKHCPFLTETSIAAEKMKQVLLPTEIYQQSKGKGNTKEEENVAGSCAGP